MFELAHIWFSCRGKSPFHTAGNSILYHIFGSSKRRDLELLHINFLHLKSILLGKEDIFCMIRNEHNLNRWLIDMFQELMSVLCWWCCRYHWVIYRHLTHCVFFWYSYFSRNKSPFCTLNTHSWRKSCNFYHSGTRPDGIFFNQGKECIHLDKLCTLSMIGVPNNSLFWHMLLQR